MCALSCRSWYKRIIKPLVSYCLLEGKSPLTEHHSPMSFIYPVWYCLVSPMSFIYPVWYCLVSPMSFIYPVWYCLVFVWFHLFTFCEIHFPFISVAWVIRCTYRIHVENEISENILKSTTTCIRTRKKQRRKPSKRSEIKVVDDANLYINLWCIGKHRALRRKGTCNFKLPWNREVFVQFNALNINVETTIVYTQVYTKVLPMSQPNARCPLIVVLLL